MLLEHFWKTFLGANFPDKREFGESKRGINFFCKSPTDFLQAYNIYSGRRKLLREKAHMPVLWNSCSDKRVSKHNGAEHQKGKHKPKTLTEPIELVCLFYVNCMP